MSSERHLSLVPSDCMIGHLEEFATWMAAWGAASTTRRHRVSIIQYALSEWGCARTVTAEQLQAWLARYSGWTATTYFNALRSYFGWLVEAGFREDNPTDAMRRPRPPTGRPRPLSRDEASRALATATGPVHTWLLLGMFAGLRAHEIAKVRGEDVTPDALYVVGKGNKAAVLPMHPLIWEAAQTYPPVGWWFPSSTRVGEHVGSAWVTAATTRLFASLGIEGSIHRCRHYFGTELLRAGVSVRVIQTLMRHESLATTANYLGVDEDERMAAVRALAA